MPKVESRPLEVMIRAAQYVSVFAGSAILCLAFTPIALRLARRYELFDHPAEPKLQQEAVPYLGGAAVLIAFAVTIGVGSLLLPIASGRSELAVVLAAAACLTAVGLLDDLKGLGPGLRVLMEIGAAGALLAVGVGAQVTGHPWADAALTVFWVVGVANAFNLLDNMDGLSAGVAAIAAAAFFVLAATNGQYLVAVLAASIAGASSGFLKHNVHPAAIYMGDAGALFLGFLLAYVGLKVQFETAQRVSFFVPVLVLGVAIFDTTLVTATRLIHRRNPFSGARDHVSHRLVFIGLPVRSAVGLIYLSALTCGWLAVVMARVDPATGLVLMGLVLSLALTAGVLLGGVPVYETSRRRRLMLMHVKQPAVESPAPRRAEAMPEPESA